MIWERYASFSLSEPEPLCFFKLSYNSFLFVVNSISMFRILDMIYTVKDLSDSSTLSETHIYLIFLFQYMNPIFFLPHPWHPQSIDHAVLSHIYWHGTVSLLTSSFPAALTIWWIFQLSLASWFIVSHASLSRNELRSMLSPYKCFWHSVIPFIKSVNTNFPYFCHFVCLY